MHIVMISAEVAPLAKAGGLGDFIAGLAHELAAQGQQVEILLPKYDCLRSEHLWEPHKVMDLWVPLYGDWVHCDVEEGRVDGLVCFLIDPHLPQAYFQRGRLYGEGDDAERFAFFSRAALEFIFKSGRRPDILHCHDWHTGLVPVLLREIYQGLGLSRPRLCFTLHNLGYQGVCGEHVLRLAGLDPARLLGPEGLADPGDPTRVNLLKGGIVHADYVTTVSPRYAWEARHTEQGMGLQNALLARGAQYGGILNGIDYEVWNPESDPHIAHTYCVDTLQRKARNKGALRTRLGLEEAHRPVLAVVSRLEYQKGPELIRHAAAFALAQEAQFVLLGASQDPAIQRDFVDLRRHLNGSPHAHLELAYDEALAHQILAGADLLLVPSRYEPCGLIQMMAMRYGAVPVARRVGGLMDTVFDANYSDQPFAARNGYLFDDYSEAALETALTRAFGLWRHYPEYFRQLRRNGMTRDVSWGEPARRYLELFRGLLEGG